MGGFALTVASTSNRVSYSGNGSTTAFAFAYPYRASSDLIVNVRTTATGAESLKVEGSDYTVSGTPTSDAGGFASGTVTFGTAPASGTQVHIDRVPTTTQTADLIAGDGLQPNSWEGAIDKLTLITQELDARFARTLLQPRTAANRNLILPEPSSTTAGTYLRYNSAGTGLEASGTAPTINTISVKDYGATGNGTTDDTTAVQAAINAVSALGGGNVYFPPGTYYLGALTLPDRVVLKGASVSSTTLKVKNGLNTHFIKSTNFDALQAAGNKWLHDADGMPSYLGVQDLQINGNKANQSAGDGIRIYGKGLILGPLLVRDCYANGIYTEGGDIAGQTDWYDLPEGFCGHIQIRNCGGHGWHFRGPHDTIAPGLIINQCGGDGLRIETSAGVYNGTLDIGKAHIYANTGYGVYSTAEFHASHLITESNYKEGLFLNGPWFVQIAKLEVYNNCRTSGSYQVLDSSTSNHCIISQLQIATPGLVGVGGLSINGSYQIIHGIQCYGDGATSTGIGVRVASTATHCSLQGVVRAFGGAGGTALKTNDGGASSYNEFNFTLKDCKTLWNNAAIGTYNLYRIRGRAEASQTFFTGSGPNATDCRERWDVVGDDSSGNTYLSEIRKTSGSTVDLNSTAEQIKSVGCTELLGLAPDPEDVTVALYSTGTNTTFAVQYLKVIAVSAATIDFAFKCSTAAGVAQTGNLLVTAKL